MSSQLQGATGQSLVHNSGAIAIGTTTDLFRIVTAINFSLGGIFYQKAATDNIVWTIEPNSGLVVTAPNAFVSLAAKQSCAFALFLDAAGAVTVAQGPIVQAGELCPVPQAPSGLSSVSAGGKVIFGALKIATTTAVFVPDTTALTSVTTYFNFSNHPGRPI